MDDPSPAETILEPTGPVEDDPALSECLQSIGMAHLSRQSAPLHMRSLSGCVKQLEEQGRPGFISYLKECGITSLPERQRVANAVGKCARQLAEVTAGGGGSPTPAIFPGIEPITVQLSEGLCNRLRTLLSFLIVARREGRPLVAAWPANDACPGRYYDVFEPLDGLIVCDTPPSGLAMKMPPHGHDFHPEVKGTGDEWIGYEELTPAPAVRKAIAAAVRLCAPGYVSMHVRHVCRA